MDVSGNGQIGPLDGVRVKYYKTCAFKLYLSNDKRWPTVKRILVWNLKIDP